MDKQREKLYLKQTKIYLFCSFDISDSTRFKVENPRLWPMVFSSYYDEAIHFFQNETTRVKPWKFMGDEVLVYSELSDVDDLYSKLQRAVKMQKIIMHRVEENVAKRCKSFGFSEEQITEIRELVDEKLGIKLTLWLAECSSEAHYKAANIVYHGIADNGQMITDFIGPDIDEGFRIAKYAKKNRLVVTPLLAWVLWNDSRDDEEKMKQIASKFKISAYVVLKGVWGGRKYPLIIHSDDFSELKDEMEYDEMDSELYAEMRSIKYSEYLEDDNYNLAMVDKILKNVRKIKAAERIAEKLGGKQA